MLSARVNALPSSERISERSNEAGTVAGQDAACLCGAARRQAAQARASKVRQETGLEMTQVPAVSGPTAVTSRRRPIVQQPAAQLLWGYNVRMHQIEAELTGGAKTPAASKKKPVGVKPEGK